MRVDRAQSRSENSWKAPAAVKEAFDNYDCGKFPRHADREQS
jgi:hypothetical protein